MPDATSEARLSPLAIFLAFLRLGLTSFGGPIAHLGYFRAELIERRKWLTAEAYADIVALSQFLPGPASSQTGFLIGLRTGGWPGALAAFVGFTLPSATLMIAAAFGLATLQPAWLPQLAHALKLVAASVVAHAVITMARAQIRSLAHGALALMALVALLFNHAPLATPGVIAIAMLAGAALPARSSTPARPSIKLAHVWPALLAVLLLAALPVLASLSAELRLADTFYRAGALVFGGGHVVLPLLQQSLHDQLTAETFLAGYGLAQAMPGPLFSIAGYLGALAHPDAPSLAGAIIATLAIFAPGLLLAAGLDGVWRTLPRDGRIGGAVKAAGAAVVGVLAAALWDPVLVSAMRSPIDGLISLAGFAALMWGRVPVIVVVIAVAAAGMFAV